MKLQGNEGLINGGKRDLFTGGGLLRGMGGRQEVVGGGGKSSKQPGLGSERKKGRLSVKFNAGTPW